MRDTIRSKFYLRLQNPSHLTLQSAILTNSFRRKGPKPQETGTPPPRTPLSHPTLYLCCYTLAQAKPTLKADCQTDPTPFTWRGEISTEAFWRQGAPGKQNRGGEGVLLKSLVCNSFQRRIHWHLNLKTHNYCTVSEWLLYKRLL